jgi:hypothetical protein
LGVIWDFKTNSIIIKMKKEHPVAYVYLIDLHTFVDERLAAAKQKLNNIGDNPLESRFEQGRVEILSDCKSFLTEKFNPRLPRRIREHYLGK